MSKTFPSEIILSNLLDLGLCSDSSESKFRLMVLGSIDDLSILYSLNRVQNKKSKVNIDAR